MRYRVIKSEFDQYLNMQYVDLGPGHWCLELQLFVEKRTMADEIDQLEKNCDQINELAGKSIKAGDIDRLNKANKLDARFEQLIAKMELEVRFPFKEQN